MTQPFEPFTLTKPCAPARRVAPSSWYRRAHGCKRLDGKARRLCMHPDLVVGKRFPDLELPDHRGQPTRLSELMHGFPLILSFYRGYW